MLKAASEKEQKPISDILSIVGTLNWCGAFMSRSSFSVFFSSIMYFACSLMTLCSLKNAIPDACGITANVNQTNDPASERNDSSSFKDAF